MKPGRAADAETDAERLRERERGRAGVRLAADADLDARDRDHDAEHVRQRRFEVHEVRDARREACLADRRHDHHGARAADDRAERDRVRPRPAVREPSGPRDRHRHGRDREDREAEGRKREEGAPAGRLGELAEAQAASAIEEDDHQRERAEVRRERHELLALHETSDGPEDDPDGDEPDDVRDARPLEDDLADDPDEEDRRDRQEEKGDRIHRADCNTRLFTPAWPSSLSPRRGSASSTRPSCRWGTSPDRASARGSARGRSR